MRPISQAASGAVAALLRAAPLSPGKVQFAWNAVVGGAMARATRVHLDGGTLLVDAATSEWTREVTRSTGVILKRLEALLGPGVVAGLQVRARGPQSPRS
jgi:hypothetical protein